MIGWVLVGVGAFEAVSRLSKAHVYLGLPAAETVAVLDGFWVPGAALLIIALLQLFPDGCLLSRRWRPLAWLGALATGLLTLVFFVAPPGPDQPGWPTAWSTGTA